MLFGQGDRKKTRYSIAILSVGRRSNTRIVNAKKYSNICGKIKIVMKLILIINHNHHHECQWTSKDGFTGGVIRAYHLQRAPFHHHCDLGHRNHNIFPNHLSGH